MMTFKNAGPCGPAYNSMTVTTNARKLSFAMTNGTGRRDVELDLDSVIALNKQLTAWIRKNKPAEKKLYSGTL